MKTAKEHNHDQGVLRNPGEYVPGESGFHFPFKNDAVKLFESLMNEFGYKIVDVKPPPDFTKKVMRRIRKARKLKS